MELVSFLVTLLLVLSLFSVSTTTFAVVHNDTIRPLDILRHNYSNNSFLVSKEGRFVLKFFTLRNKGFQGYLGILCNDIDYVVCVANPCGFFNHLYLGIWYNNITSYSDVVWVANRCEAIIVTSGLLSIDNRGNLVLFSEENNSKREIVWSTNSSKQAAKPLVQLLDNGNLVLRDEKDDNTTNYLWESFYYPTDSLLPGMKLGWDLRRGLNRRLSSWKSSDDPCHGNFTYGIEFDEELHTYPQLIARNGTAIFYRQGMWDSISSSQNSGYEFVYNDDEVFYIQNNKSMISRIVMRDDGRIEHQDWRENFYSLICPGDQCDSYGFCGANSQCNVTTVTQDYGICYCLKGFKQKNQEQWSEGCERLYSPASCHDEEKEEFREYLGMRVPDTKNSLVSKSNNASECESKCLTNCSCMAYSFTYSESNVFVADTVCVLWFGDLFDIRQLPSGGGGGHTHLKIESRTDPKREEKVKVKSLVMIIGIIIGLGGGILLIAFCICRKTHIFERNENKDDELELPFFHLHTISLATDNFSEANKLGEGGFGPVYKGTLEGGQEIAVKSLSMCSGQGASEFKNEIKLIAKLQHRNLVKIFGYY
ncbi:G-type lectin S-receptor-like serine/threonine-protein kinase At4g27290 [Cannabis sativa]|uniref:G-type lectin S-receptor-like serine/threonine-protein kinase At4g27290 n=1 Tax=Cannabis sativa TaxID=3483 RepID=UPI0029CA4244|nr:G-type lectin S-receptor-like serine/threonine-protein kinase At4g27290 [Cannabis sativa]